MRTINQLELFVVVADNESFSKASEKMGMTTSTVMRQINSLEKEIGFELFFRSFQGLQMTSAGKNFYHNVKKLLKFYRYSIEESNQKKDDEYNIRIGIMGSYSMKLFINEWNFINDHISDIKLSFVQYDGGMNMPEDLRVEADINLVVEALDKKFAAEHGLKTLETAKIRYFCGMNPNHRFADKRKICIEELQGEKIIFVPRGYSESSDKLYREWEERNISLHIEEGNVCALESFNNCINNNKIIIFSETLKDEYPLMKKIPLETEEKIPFGITYAINHSKKVEKILNLVSEYKKELNSVR